MLGPQVTIILLWRFGVLGEAQIIAQGCGPLRCGEKVLVGAQVSLTVVGLVGTSEERREESSQLGEVHLQMYLGRAFCLEKKHFLVGGTGQKRWRRRRLEQKVGTNLLGLFLVNGHT